jgi:hypothetical protein
VRSLNDAYENLSGPKMWEAIELINESFDESMQYYDNLNNSQSELNGSWQLISDINNQNSLIEIYNLTQNVNEITASNACINSNSIYGTVNGNEIAFSYIDNNYNTIIYNGTFSQGQMSGVISSGSSQIGTFLAEKLSQLDPKNCITETTAADAFCVFFPNDNSYYVEANIIDQLGLIKSATITGSNIVGSLTLIYNKYIDKPGEWWTESNIYISQNVTPVFPLTYTIHITFKDNTTADIVRTVISYELAQ